MLTIKKWVVSRKKNINTRRRRFLNRESTVYFVYKKIQYDTAFSIYNTVPGRIPTWYNTRLYYSSYSLILDYYDRLVTRIPGITISLWYLQNKNHPFFVLVIFWRRQLTKTTWGFFCTWYYSRQAGFKPRTGTNNWITEPV